MNLINSLTCELLDTSGVVWSTLEGNRVFMCIQTMVVVGNRYTINAHVVGDKYWWSVIGILHSLSSWHTITKRIITRDSRVLFKETE